MKLTCQRPVLAAWEGQASPDGTTQTGNLSGACERDEVNIHSDTRLEACCYAGRDTGNIS